MNTRLLTVLLAALPALALAAEPAPTNVDVYVSGTDGYHTFRIPAIETAPDGTLLAFAEARKYSSEDPGYGKQEIDLVLKHSSDGGATWSAMSVVEHVGDLWASANPSTLVDRSNGKIWVFYVRGRPTISSDNARPGTDDMGTRARWSADNGKTWSESIDLTSVARDMNDKTWRVSVPGPGGAIQTRSGRLLVALWKMPFSDLAMYSDDHGKTWHRSQIVPGPQGGDESKLAELSNGHILHDMRQEKGPTRWFSESADGGATWGNPRPGIKVTAVACAFKAYDHGGHHWLLWTGPEGSKRQRLVLRASSDDGQTFGHKQLLTTQYSAYSDLGVLKDGSVGVLWERGVKANYETITFTHLTQPWLDAAFAAP